MITLIRPDGGRTWVHESRLDEYLGRGFKLPSPAPAEPAAPTAAKRTRKPRQKSSKE